VTDAARAVGQGVWNVLRAPALLVTIYLVTLLAALPFGISLGARLQDALGQQHVTRGQSSDIDAEWWQEFRRHAQGLEATFTPSVIGVAAPLDSLSALLDGKPRSLALALPVLAYAAIWMFLWGGILERLWRRRAIGVRNFMAAGVTHFPRFLAIGAAAALVYLVLYATVHSLLFGPVYAWLAAASPSEYAPLAARVALYFVFVLLLTTVNLVVDYARIWSVAQRGLSLGAAVRHAVMFVRANAGRALLTDMLVGVLFLLLLVGYGAVEILGGARVGGWRAVLLGQVYIMGRLALRLIFAASAIALLQRSTAPLMPGPPPAA
jgi:hypothetical protein